MAVIGCGQIGGSILKRLASLRPKIDLIAHDRDRRLSIKVARHADWVTRLEDAAKRADILIIATPVHAIVSLLDRIAEVELTRSEKPLVIDTGSTRVPIHARAARHKSRFDHLGLHPLAGAEKEGWDSSRGDLFEGTRIVVTPAARSRRPIVRDLINVLGATAMPMEAKDHDRLAAEAIGLPHVLAFAAQGLSPVNPLRAGSWASLTRVAASNREMVADFIGANAREQRRAISRFERELERFRRALDDRAGTALLKLLNERHRTEN